MGSAGRSQQDAQPTQPAPGSSSRKTPSGPGLLAKFPFMRVTADSPKADSDHDDDAGAHPPGPRAIATAVQQQHRTRRRRGSLRKVALLGRGAQHDRKDSSPLTVDTVAAAPSTTESARAAPKAMDQYDALGLSATDVTPRATTDGHSSQASAGTTSSVSSTYSPQTTDPRKRESPTLYTSTTDEDDMLQLPHGRGSVRPGLAMSPGSESYFANIERRRSFHQAKSPLSYSGLSATPLPPPDTDWDYTETEWWGWVVLTVTWFVFVIGMGSCFGVWSWAWDVGKTPYAPPELEDDPTLPIVGYYPALIILTGVMAWVWVVVAWVGMKYFRHAKISGD